MEKGGIRALAIALSAALAFGPLASFARAANPDSETIIGFTEVVLTTYDANGIRAVRKQETNIGNFVSVK